MNMTEIQNLFMCAHSFPLSFFFLAITSNPQFFSVISILHYTIFPTSQQLEQINDVNPDSYSEVFPSWSQEIDRYSKPCAAIVFSRPRLS